MARLTESVVESATPVGACLVPAQDGPGLVPAQDGAGLVPALTSLQHYPQG